LKADVLKHRIPTDEIKQIFLNFFEEGKSPSKALFTFKSNLRNTKGNYYYVYAGDREELQDPQWMYYLYYKTFKQHFGASYGNAIMISLAEAVNVNNLESNTNRAAIKVLEDGKFAIAISTPLMQRISCDLEECGEMLFIDASGNIDMAAKFVIYTNSCVGGLPIGTIILTSEFCLHLQLQKVYSYGKICFLKMHYLKGVRKDLKYLCLTIRFLRDMYLIMFFLSQIFFCVFFMFYRQSGDTSGILVMVCLCVIVKFCTQKIKTCYIQRIKNNYNQHLIIYCMNH